MESLGLDVEDSIALASEVDGELEELAKRVGAIAVIRVSAKGGGTVEMVILDRATGKTVRRQLVSSSVSDPAAAELITLRTVELLRASLMELKSPHPSRGEVSVPPQVEALAYVPPPPPPSGVKPTSIERAEKPRKLYANIYGGAAIQYAFDWSEGVQFRAGGTVPLSRAFRGQGELAIPVSPMRHRGAEGNTTLDVTHLRLGAEYDVRYSRVGFAMLGGVNLAHLNFSGHPVLPYGSDPVNLLAYGGYLGANLSLRLVRRWSLRLEQTVYYLVPNTVVRFAGQRTATFGQPYGATALALEWVLP